MKTKITAIITLILTLASCVSVPKDAVQSNAPVNMYPDYADVTIPQNIAPLNFLIRDNAVTAVCVTVNGETMYSGSGSEVNFDQGEWRDMLKSNVGKNLDVQVFTEADGKWTAWKTFQWTVAPEPVDAYLTYRLIEPDYEVFNNLQIQERCVENFDVRNISDYKHTPGRCMNCHTYASQSPDLSMLYVRGEGGGAILNQGGKLSKLNIKTDDMVSGSVYFGFHPSGRYITFSSNVIVPTFHSEASKRMEVVDQVSDVYALDLETDEIIRSPLLADSLYFETFPAFSPDGKFIYYCSSPRITRTDQLEELQYSLCRVPFSDGKIGETVDTIYSASRNHHSVCHPRISPDGRFLVFTEADYGTFPIWHRESDLAIIDLKAMAANDSTKAANDSTKAAASMAKANSDQSDTYHSWSSNSRWLVFASKRDDGLYGKPYFTYIDAQGIAHKPFVLPQAHPQFYDNCLKSFNAPELGTGPLPFSADDVAKAIEQPYINVK